MRRRVLILGAGGFIGRRLVGRLAADPNYEVLAGQHRRPLDLPPAAVAVPADATRPERIQGLASAVDVVVLAVAGSSEAIRASASSLAQAFAELRRSTTTPALIHLSSMAVYGDSNGWVDEAHPTAPIDDYGRAKVAAEAALANTEGVVTFRPGLVYGPESPLWSGLIGDLLLRRRLGDLGPKGLGHCNLVHVDDLVTAITRAMDKPFLSGRVFHLGLPGALTWNDYFRAYAEALGANPLKPISAFRLAAEVGLIGPALKLHEKATGKPSLTIRPWLLRHCAHDLRLDVRRAETELGMRWTPLEDGLRQTARWFLSQPRAR